MEINKELKDEIWDYCRVNNISNIDEFTLKLIRQGFTIEKFGATPAPKEKVVEKIVEKIIEVEKIVEKVVEVPVEKIVEKEIIITNDEEVIQLRNRLIELANSEAELIKLKTAFNDLQKLLEEEKKKNKKDIYGETN